MCLEKDTRSDPISRVRKEVVEEGISRLLFQHQPSIRSSTDRNVPWSVDGLIYHWIPYIQRLPPTPVKFSTLTLLPIYVCTSSLSSDGIPRTPSLITSTPSLGTRQWMTNTFRSKESNWREDTFYPRYYQLHRFWRPDRQLGLGKNKRKHHCLYTRVPTIV